jgi:hypothetical protein
MIASALFTTENKNNSPVLIVDKEGLIGEKLANKIKTETTVVFVSNKKPQQAENVIHIPYIKNFPRMPDNKYSHIIIIDEKLSLDKKILESLIKKAKKDRSFVFIGVDRDSVVERFFAEIVLRNDNVKLGILGEIFSSEDIVKNGAEVNKILTSIKTHGIINIPGNGISENWPVFLDDAVDAISEICFSEVKEKTIYIMPKTPITFLSLALNFKKVFPEIRLDFTKEEKIVKKNNLLLQGKYIFGEKYDLGERIKKINIEKIEGFEKTKISAQPVTKYPIFLTSLFLILLLFLPLLTTFICFGTGRILVNNTSQLVNKDKPVEAEVFAKISKQLFFVSKTSVNILNQELRIINQENNLKELTQQVSNYYLLSDLNENFLSAINQLNTAPKNYRNIILSTNRAIKEMNLLIINDKQLLPEYMHGINNDYLSLVNYLPEVLGLTKQKIYLVILLDNNEVSSSSAIINSYAILKIDSGKIKTEGLIKLSTPSADIKQIKLQTSIDGLVRIDNTFLTRFVNNFNNTNTVTIKLLIFLENSLKENHLSLLFANQLLSQTIVLNK